MSDNVIQSSCPQQAPCYDKKKKKTRQRQIRYGSCFKQIRIWETTSKYNPCAASLLVSQFLHSPRSSSSTAGSKEHSAPTLYVFSSITPSWSLIIRLHAQGSDLQVAACPVEALMGQVLMKWGHFFLLLNVAASIWGNKVHPYNTRKTKKTAYTGKCLAGKVYALLSFKLCSDV